MNSYCHVFHLLYFFVVFGETVISMSEVISPVCFSVIVLSSVSLL